MESKLAYQKSICIISPKPYTTIVGSFAVGLKKGTLPTMDTGLKIGMITVTTSHYTHPNVMPYSQCRWAIAHNNCIMSG